MKILLTGGAGFIGSHLSDKWVSDGHSVTCIDNFMNGNLNNVKHLLHHPNFTLIKGDIGDFALLEKLMQGVDAVFHLAAQVHVDRSLVEPGLTWQINVMGTQNILDAARINNIKKVVYASSSEVYGSAQHVPINENHPLNAPHPYGASKIAADRMCYAYIQTYGMNISIARLFNVFGPRQRDVGYGGVISIFTRRILSGAPPIIYGDGSQTRDYTYIEDTVQAYDLLLKRKEPIKEPINFGTGKEVSIIYLAKRLIELCGKKNQMKPVFVDPRIGEVKQLICDASLAKKVLGWKPVFPIEEGLEKFVQWYKNYGFEERIKIE